MPANVSSNPFTDPAILFADVAAANAWRLSLTVPNATTGTRGVMLEGVAVTFTYSAPPACDNFDILQGDGSTITVPIGSILTSMGQLSSTITALLTSLRNAGIIHS